jgi:hypothetical protein
VPRFEVWGRLTSAWRRRCAAALDRLPRRLTTSGGGSSGPGFAAALAATADGAWAALAVAAEDPARIGRARAAFAAGAADPTPRPR